jgi:hypothetical protein
MTALGKAWHPERPHIRSRCCRAFALPMLLVLQHRGSMEISQEPPCLLLFHLYKGLALCATSCIWHESSGLPLHTCPRSGQPRTRKGFYGRLNVSVLVTECMRERKTSFEEDYLQVHREFVLSGLSMRCSSKPR